jgi:hypothetical protein
MSSYDRDYGPYYANVINPGDNQVHIVWLGAPFGQRWHEYSLDGGVTWSRPVQLDPELRGITQFAALSADANEDIHLVTAGFGLEGSSTRFYYTKWDGQGWAPFVDLEIANPERNGERPQLVTRLGNQLVVMGQREAGIWSGQVDLPIPALAPVSLPLSVTHPTARALTSSTKEDVPPLTIPSQSAALRAEPRDDLKFGGSRSPNYGIMIGSLFSAIVVGISLFLHSRR